jgi:peptidoglycan/LPS O-acetylase OafA/YrhL
LYQAENGVIATVLLVLSNVVILGQDAMLFIGKWPHLLSRDYFYHFFMYVGPAWTIEVEFFFYAMAPFVVRGRIIWPIALLAGSLIARLIAVALGNTAYIDAYDFPPFEMAFFMAGSLTYRAYAYLRTQKSRWISVYSLVASAAVTLLSVFFARPIYLLAVCPCLPGIVLVGRRNPLDNFFGELSYPIYLLHPIFTILIVPGVTIWAEIVAVAGTVSISAFLMFALDRPIELFRQRRLNSSKHLDFRVADGHTTARQSA